MTPRLTRIAATAALAVSLAVAPGAFAASEQGDAGDLPGSAQDLGAGPVSHVGGSFTTAADADVYRVCLANGTSFSASTVGATSLDTQLFLFDADGRGVYANDDWDDDDNERGSQLPAGHRFSPARGGVYYLAISSFNIDPQSSHGEIFQDEFDVDDYPDRVLDANGFGSEGPLESWAGRERGRPGVYLISLTGTAMCDSTPPAITVTSPAEGGVYPVGQVVAADYSCGDEAGGSGVASCTGTVPDGAPIDTSSVGQKTFTVEATDAAGNSASKSVTYTVADITPPGITLTTPTEGAVYTLGQSVLAAFGCADQAGGSGVSTCEGTVPNGVPIDTSTLGAHSFEVRASDHAGNTATRIVTYRVVYSFDGFLWPVQNPPNVNRWKAGAPVPIRFSLNGFKGERPEAPGYPRSMRCGGGGSQQVARSRSSKRPVFRYERRTDRYVMLWKTERRWAGSCREFVLQLDDGSVHTAKFEFVKRLGRDRDDDDRGGGDDDD